MGEAANILTEMMDLLGVEDTEKEDPVGEARAGLMLMAGCKSDVELLARAGDFKKLMVSVMGWHQPKFTYATKAFVKTAAAGLRDKYSVAVEAISYVSAVSPELDPDRCITLLKHCLETNNAYAPNTYLLQFNSVIHPVLSHYKSADVRLRLATTAWDIAHTGRWWDRMRQDDDAQVVGGVQDVRKGVLDGTVHLSDEAIEWAKNTAPDVELVVGVGKVRDEQRHGGMCGPDHAVVVSYIPWLRPSDRMETPLLPIYRAAWTCMDPGNWPEGLAAEIPDKPKDIAALVPEKARQAVFQFLADPELVAAFMRALPDGYTASVIRTSEELEENRNYMGNCTGGLAHSMKEGKIVLFRIEGNGNTFNAAYYQRADRGDWRCQEINSRHNRGGVPRALQASYTRVGGINVGRDFLEAIRRRERAEEARGNIGVALNKALRYQV